MKIRFHRRIDTSDLAGFAAKGIEPRNQPEQSADAFCAEVKSAAGEDALEAIAEFLTGAGAYLYIGGVFSTEGLTNTPDTGFNTEGNDSWFPGGFALLGLLRGVGLRCVSYQCENNGKIIVNLVPKKGTSEEDEKSRGDMRGHTDACCFPFADEPLQDMSPAPDYVVLVCYRNPGNTPTRVAPLTTIMKLLALTDIQELMKPHYVIGNQLSFKFGEEGYRRRSAAVIDKSPVRGYQIRFSHSNVTAPGREVVEGSDTVSSEEIEKEGNAQRALESLHVAVKKSGVDVAMEPGSILLINNRTAIHGRAAIEGEAGSGGDQSRWLQRAYCLLPATKAISANVQNSPWILKP